MSEGDRKVGDESEIDEPRKLVNGKFTADAVLECLFLAMFHSLVVEGESSGESGQSDRGRIALSSHGTSVMVTVVRVDMGC